MPGACANSVGRCGQDVHPRCAGHWSTESSNRMLKPAQGEKRSRAKEQVPIEMKQGNSSDSSWANSLTGGLVPGNFGPLLSLEMDPRLFRVIKITCDHNVTGQVITRRAQGSDISLFEKAISKEDILFNLSTTAGFTKDAMPDRRQSIVSVLPGALSTCVHMGGEIPKPLRAHAPCGEGCVSKALIGLQDR